MYIEVNKQIEYMSNVVYLFVAKLTVPGLIIPALLLTLANYFIYDLGDDSYYLPILVM